MFVMATEIELETSIIKWEDVCGKKNKSELASLVKWLHNYFIALYFITAFIHPLSILLRDI